MFSLPLLFKYWDDFTYHNNLAGWWGPFFLHLSPIRLICKCSKVSFLLKCKIVKLQSYKYKVWIWTCLQILITRNNNNNNTRNINQNKYQKPRNNSKRNVKYLNKMLIKEFVYRIHLTKNYSKAISLLNAYLFRRFRFNYYIGDKLVFLFSAWHAKITCITCPNGMILTDISAFFIRVSCFWFFW